jgi:acylphosphatase
MNNSRAHLVIAGIVQGVFYRAFTKGVALSLHLNGWVRNLKDGRVEAVLEGDRDAVEEAVGKLREGPPGAKVADVALQWEPWNGEEKGFDIRY